MRDDLETFRSMLAVRKNHLDDELEIQAEVMDRINRQVVAANSRMLSAKDELARLEARLGDEIKDDEPKLSLPAIDGKVKRHRERLDLWKRFQDAREHLEEWQGLHEAWKQKGYSIKTASDLYSAGYFTINSTSSSPRHRERDAGHDGRRADMRRANETAGAAPRTRRAVID